MADNINAWFSFCRDLENSPPDRHRKRNSHINDKHDPEPTHYLDRNRRSQRAAVRSAIWAVGVAAHGSRGEFLRGGHHTEQCRGGADCRRDQRLRSYELPREQPHRQVLPRSSRQRT